MKIEDIKKAYDSVSANDDLKAKVFSRLESETEDVSQSVLPQHYDAETEEDIPKMEIEMSHIQRKKGGGSRLAATAFFAAAMIALVFVIRKTTFDVEIVTPPADVTETTVSEVVEIPENTALVTLRVVDENGVPVKNKRIDYLPITFITQDGSTPERGFRDSYVFDMENFDKGGTIPVTYGRDMELLIPYGDYYFNVSTSMPNVEYDMFMLEFSHLITFMDDGGGFSQVVNVDENTEEIVLTDWGGNNPYNEYNYPKLGVILQDAMGVPLPGYTVILKPTDGVMMEGYSDKYGGYVLTVTDENGEAFWRNTPISGEYEVIAYKEELHLADESILNPFVFDGDNTFSYVPNDTGIIYEKTFRMAE